VSAGDSPRAERAALADLDVLQRRGPAPVRARRPWFPRVVVLLLVLGGLAAIYGAFLDPLLFPPREVRLAPVRAAETAGGGGARHALATAPGWLEAGPYPITVRPLVTGVVEHFEVVEGQAVTKGETVIAILRSAEIENAVRTAQAEVASREARVAAAEAHTAHVRAIFEQKIDLRAAVLTADLRASRSRESVPEAEAALAASEATLEKARVEVEAQRALQGSGGTPPISLRLAEAALRAAEAERTMRQAARARMRAELDVDERMLRLAEEALREPRALAGDVTVAEKEEEAARAEARAATTALEVALSNAALLTVRAPATGLVERLLCAPGAPAGPMGDMREPVTVGPGASSGLDATTGGLALLYDPARLQVRVEVPVGDLPAIGVGTEAGIEIDAVRGRTLRGEVLRLVGEANIQNNKLWVKVRLLDTHPLLRPEMLCRVKFLARADAPGEPRAGTPHWRVPTAAVLGDAVFVFDPTRGGRARRVPVVRHGDHDGFTEVEGALGVSNDVILDPQGLGDGTKVKGVK
jgi:multidrug resistance efflux pump